MKKYEVMRLKFEEEMRAYGYTNAEMARDEDTGDYYDPELLAMWCGWELGWGSVGARGGKRAVALSQELLAALESMFEAEYGSGLRPSYDELVALIAKAKNQKDV